MQAVALVQIWAVTHEVPLRLYFITDLMSPNKRVESSSPANNRAHFTLAVVHHAERCMTVVHGD